MEDSKREPSVCRVCSLQKGTNNIPIHSFPEFENITKKWMYAIEKRNVTFKYDDAFGVCGRHFPPECYAFNKSSHRDLISYTLAWNAVPTLFDKKDWNLMFEEASTSEQVYMMDAYYTAPWRHPAENYSSIPHATVSVKKGPPVGKVACRQSPLDKRIGVRMLPRKRLKISLPEDNEGLPEGGMVVRMELYEGQNPPSIALAEPKVEVSDDYYMINPLTAAKEEADEERGHSMNYVRDTEDRLEGEVNDNTEGDDEIVVKRELVEEICSTGDQLRAADEGHPHQQSTNLEEFASLKFIVDAEFILQLFTKCFDQNCGGEIEREKLKVTSKGTNMEVHWSCIYGHQGDWSSQPSIGSEDPDPQGNIEFSTAIVLTNNTYEEIAEVAATIGLNIHSKEEHERLVKKYVKPSIGHENH